ncbi:MAG: hypothetical protein NC112_06190 [Oxalobacter formigenes]|nr:hypothetical protein [Oxalobacter formigenes]
MIAFCFLLVNGNEPDFAILAALLCTSRLFPEDKARNIARLKKKTV